ncbi:MAG: S8 family serine peptidase [Candidatus Heimdallarchaeaceae archaeon]
MPPIKTTLKVLLLISLCFVRYGSYANISSSNTLSTFQESNVQIVIKDKLFYQQLKKASLDTQFRVLIKLSKTYEKFNLRAYGHFIRNFESYSGVAVTISKRFLLYLINNHFITDVWNNSEISLTGSIAHPSSFVEYNRSVCNVSKQLDIPILWQQGIFGNDTRVAILDTGISLNHPALNETLSGIPRIIAKWNFIDNSSNVVDDNGHGTALAGIIGSNGKYGYQLGVAPNSLFLIGKILDSAGKGTIEDLIAGIDWAIENNAEVINLSVGRPVQSLSAPEIESVNYAADLGIIVCVAAGNYRGRNQFGYNDLFTIMSPGAASKAITVGAIDNNNILYEYSSAGPVAINYNSSISSFVYDSIELNEILTKPDVVAPGVMINTTSSFSSWDIVTGTSFAAGVISGICSLLKQKFPHSHSATIKAAIIDTATPVKVYYNSPFNISKSFTPQIMYQGAGLVDIKNVLGYLIDPPLFSLWPTQLPYLSSYLFVNEKVNYKFHVFVNKKLTSPINIKINKIIGSLFKVDGNLTDTEIGQYDLTLNINTEQCYPAHYSGTIAFTNDNFTHYLNLDVIVKFAYGKGLIEFFEGNKIKYLPYGSLYTVIEHLQKNGFVPMFRIRDSTLSSLSSMNLNNYETILIFNFDGSSINYAPSELEALKDYMFPGGNYGGGSIAIFPSIQSNLTALNSLISTVNAQYTFTAVESEILNTTGIFTNLFNYPNRINNLYVPHPLVLSEYNASLLSFLNRFAIEDFRYKNGSIMILGNSAEMFLSSPYIYTETSNTYEENSLSLEYGDNAKLLDNMLFALYPSHPVFNLKIKNHEIKDTEPLSGTLTVLNRYKYMPGWKLYLTLQFSDWYSYRYEQIQDLGNGTYTFSFLPKDLGIKPGDYTIEIRCAGGTISDTIKILANFSWGPVLVEFSLVVCIIYLVSFQKQPKKSREQKLKKE